VEHVEWVTWSRWFIYQTKPNWKNVYILGGHCLCFSPPSTMKSTCSFCTKVFNSDFELFKHISACSLKNTCSIALPSGSVTAHRNSNNQWPCYCDLTKCKNKIFTTVRALQQHIRRDAKPDIKWKVSYFPSLCNHSILILFIKSLKKWGSLCILCEF